MNSMGRAHRMERGVYAASSFERFGASTNPVVIGRGSGLKAALLRANSGRAQQAFTMVEIALCLGIIGFALVAIIGILPTGTNVQKENREETIISHDATYFMEAIRNGAQGIDDLPVYVSAMYDANGQINPSQHGSGQRIIGLLSRPKFRFPNPTIADPTRAEVWAISGPATAKGASQNKFGFKYLLTAEITPVGGAIGLPPGYPADPLDVNAANDALAFQSGHLHEIRLTFRWPVLGNSGVGAANAPVVKTGTGRLVFRSLVSGAYTLATNAQGTVYYYFLPRPVQ
jgi:type II secretory pathway pseudopilin PulG